MGKLRVVLDLILTRVYQGLDLNCKSKQMVKFESIFEKDKPVITTVEKHSGLKETDIYEGKLTLFKAVVLIEDQRERIRKTLRNNQKR